MLDGLQMCENEPNFDSNIIHTEHTGVEKKGSSSTAQGWAVFFSVSQLVQDAGGVLAWLRAKNDVSKSQQCAKSAAPHRARPK